jgi:hypothetical protein
MISLLVPFRADIPDRVAVWSWLQQYWATELPDAELVVGTDYDTPFSKAVAVNAAARDAHGDVFVILDADAFLYARQILDAARWIKRSDYPLWFIPYRRLYRLTQEATAQTLASEPEWPLRWGDPPPGGAVQNMKGSAFGHWFGAMCQVLSRDAFYSVHGMDERFRGWGGEDICFVRAVDTMYGKHKTVSGPVYHLHHHRTGDDLFRQWEGQPPGERANDWLSLQYGEAYGDRARMRTLIEDVDETGYERS